MLRHPLRFCKRDADSVYACMILLRVRSVCGAPALLRQVYSVRRISTTWWTKYSEEDINRSRTQVRAPKKSSISSCHLQVLGTGGGELKPCLFLFTDSKRYMFNCVENVQRFCNEYRVRHSKLSHFFITRTTCDSMGGLPGQALYFSSFYDRLDAPNFGPIQLHGPDSLTNFVFCSRFHIHPPKIQMKANDVLEAVRNFRLPVYRDENVTIHTLNLHSTNRPASPVSFTDSREEAPRTKGVKVFQHSNCVSVFLCKLSDVPGKFYPEKAAELGLRKGPMYRALVDGESVTAPNGRVIHPSDVLGPTQIGPSFIVLECPDEGYVPSITGHPLLQKESFDASKQRVSLVVHISPRTVLENDNYCQWMANFGPETKHLLLHETLCPPDWTLREILNAHGPLHLLQPSLFRKFSESHSEVESPDSLKVLQFLPRECVIVGQPLLQYHLKPCQKEGVDEGHVLEPFPAHWRDLVTKVRANPVFQRALDKVPKTVKSTSSTLSAANDVSVTFLGTGASTPSMYRNVSSILLQTASSGNVLLDAGDGTLSQLYRHFGRDEGEKVLANLATIFISHIHGDHNLGLMSLLNERAKILQRGVPSDVPPAPTCVLGPQIVGFWLRDYNRLCQKLNYRFIDCKTLTEGDTAIGFHRVLSFQTVPVIHCKNAYGVVISHKNDWRIVYSGDTRPCPALTAVGRNATLLLHEATLEDDLLDDAKAKKHCTISEALEVAKQMNPKFTILTHFSLRYSRILPFILGKRSDMNSKVFLAFDHMTVSLSDMHSLPALLPAVQDIMAYTNEDEQEPESW